MKNGVGVAQNIVLFGGTSEIGQAIIHKLVKPGVSHVVLVSRDIDAADQQIAEHINGGCSGSDAPTNKITTLLNQQRP